MWSIFDKTPVAGLKIKAKKKFIEEQNNVQKTALAKGDRMKSADRYS